jgi:DNA-binding beta-propeller fold protein YncE
LNRCLTSKKICFALALLSGGAAFSAHAQSDAHLKLTQTIPLPGVEGRIDHLAVDAVGERLFVCALGSNSVEVLNLRKGQRIHSITGLGAPQGIAYVPESDRIFVANDKGGICRIYDGKLFQPVGELNFKDDADNVRYDEAAKKIYLGFGSGGIGIIDAIDGKQLGSIKLAAHPEAFEIEKWGSRIFVNIPDARQVAVIDRNERKVIATWKTDGAFGNFPMALDETNHRLFVGCRLPSKLVVLNTESGDVVASIGISGDPDDIFYDGKRHRVYVISGAGAIDILEQRSVDSYQPMTRFPTASGARTGAFMPEQDKLFVAFPHRGSQQAEVRVYRLQ